MLFDLQRRIVGDTEVWSVVGDLDLASLPRLATALGDLGSPEGNAEVTLDLSGVDYIDPLCLGALLLADLRVRRSGGQLTVLTTPAVGAMLSEIRVSEILAIRST